MRGRARPEDYARLPLRAHELLAGVPLHDVWQLDLPGRDAGVSMSEIRQVMSFGRLASLNPVVRGLFRLRGRLGALFGWDREPSSPPPGERDGPFSVLYVTDREAASEIRNATVHAFSVLALERRSEGWRLYWAIYVRPVGRITGLYMALIDPFRRWLIYPAILRSAERALSGVAAGPSRDP